jgi:hypothetical protein
MTGITVGTIFTDITEVPLTLVMTTNTAITVLAIIPVLETVGTTGITVADLLAIGGLKILSTVVDIPMMIHVITVVVFTTMMERTVVLFLASTMMVSKPPTTMKEIQDLTTVFLMTKIRDWRRSSHFITGVAAHVAIKDDRMRINRAKLKWKVRGNNVLYFMFTALKSNVTVCVYGMNASSKTKQFKKDSVSRHWRGKGLRVLE